MDTALRPLTYDDLLQMPQDGVRREIVEGELFVSLTPSRNHQETVANLDWFLQRFLRENSAGRVYTHPIDVSLSRHDIVQPDLIVIMEQRPSIYREDGVVAGPPDVIVEVTSADSRHIDRVRKMALYARSDVSEYWITDPGLRTIDIYILECNVYQDLAPDERGLIPSSVMRGLHVDPNEVFSGLD